MRNTSIYISEFHIQNGNMSCYVGLLLCETSITEENAKEQQKSFKLAGSCSVGTQQIKKIYSGKST